MKLYYRLIPIVVIEMCPNLGHIIFLGGNAMPYIREWEYTPRGRRKVQKSRKSNNNIAPRIEGAIRQKTQEQRNKQEASNKYAVGVTEEAAVEVAIEVSKIPSAVTDTLTDLYERSKKSRPTHDDLQGYAAQQDDPYYGNTPEHFQTREKRSNTTTAQEQRKQDITVREGRNPYIKEQSKSKPKIRSRTDYVPVKTKDTSTSQQTTQSVASKQVAEFGKAKFKREAQKKAAETSKQAAKKSVEWSKKTGEAIVRSVKTVVSFLVKTFGVIGLAIMLAAIVLIGIIVSSPFGILFSNEPAPNAVPLSAAVSQINMEFNRRLTSLQSGNYTSVSISGAPPNWVEVVAVFASHTAGAEKGVDVASLTPDRVTRLKNVFWQMCYISSSSETITIPDSNPNDEVDDSTTEIHLDISILGKSADDMRVTYGFTDFQNETLDLLLSPEVNLAQLICSVVIDDEVALRLLESLPANLSPVRRAVVQQALSLVGKVNYFWGGKSLVLGWDSRWGQFTKVTAAGSPTTGTYRPFGLDCSGFVDWVFYNVSSGNYIIGRGGGAGSQHRNCVPISWGSVQPGDLVFYPGDSHVGIVGGRDETGHWLIIHCASGRNNVVITDSSGFMTVGRPKIFELN